MAQPPLCEALFMDRVSPIARPTYPENFAVDY